jgi:hypothetical protein
VIRLQPVQQLVNRLAGAGYGAVDTLFCEQKCSADFPVFHEIEQRPPHGYIIIQFSKSIERTYRKRFHGDRV